jgi:hypothetical protein
MVSIMQVMMRSSQQKRHQYGAREKVWLTMKEDGETESNEGRNVARKERRKLAKIQK